VGILGGYTTFSAYMLDTRSLVVDDHLLLAAVYLLGTLVAGLASVWAGVVVARRIADDRPTSGTAS
jgi:CrcB protein